MEPVYPVFILMDHLHEVKADRLLLPWAPGVIIIIMILVIRVSFFSAYLAYSSILFSAPTPTPPPSSDFSLLPSTFSTSHPRLSFYSLSFIFYSFERHEHCVFISESQQGACRSPFIACSHLHSFSLNITSISISFFLFYLHLLLSSTHWAHLFCCCSFVSTTICGFWTTRLAVLLIFMQIAFVLPVYSLVVFPPPCFHSTWYVVVVTCHHRAKHSFLFLSFPCLSVAFICPSHIHSHFFLLTI